MKAGTTEAAIKAVVQGNHGTPMDVLGSHPCPEGVVIRALHCYAAKVEVLDGEESFEMGRVFKDGLFEYVFKGREPFAYQLRITDGDGHSWTIDDPYRFPPQLTDFDLHLFCEGTNYRAYEKMGAHPMTVDGVAGVHFAVWAPNAARMSVVGPFNRWDGRIHPMQNRGPSGLWELFIPGLAIGDLYKFEVRGRNGYLAQKSDPFGFGSELRPQTASVVCNPKAYQWNDADWIGTRANSDWLKKPISVYEVHLSSWRRNADNQWLTYRELADALVSHVKNLGFTHIELLPITEHPFDGSWGYQTIGYFSPTARFGRPDDLKFFIDRCHQEGIGVILDWVPAHFPKDGHGLAYFDGTHLYEHADPRKGEHRDWGTLIFNYGRNEVRSFLMSSAVYWAEVFHIDGLRVDAVASMLYLDYSRKAGEWIPNQFGGRENLEAVDFLKRFNEVVHREFPGFLTFAEESTAWPMVSRPTYLGGLGFGLKWNMGWMHDTLKYFEKECIHRKFHHGQLTFSLIYAFNENFILPFSHDEVVHGKKSMLDKMPGDLWQKFANLRVLYAFMWAHPGKKLLFMGCEFGQWAEWNYQHSLDWHLLQHDAHQKLQNLVARLNEIYQHCPALHEIDFTWEGFEWIDLHDGDQSTLSFVRKGISPDELVVCAFNLTPVPREKHRVGVPREGRYDQIFNSDSSEFGGSGMEGAPSVESAPVPWNNQKFSIPVVLPPLGAVYFRLQKTARPAIAAPLEKVVAVEDVEDAGGL